MPASISSGGRAGGDDGAGDEASVGRFGGEEGGGDPPVDDGGAEEKIELGVARPVVLNGVGISSSNSSRGVRGVRGVRGDSGRESSPRLTMDSSA